MSDELHHSAKTSELPEIQGNKTQPTTVREKSFGYALRAINLYRYLQKQRDGAGWILGKQYLRAACSIGANVEEAQSGESRADFVHKLGIAHKEARESLYWLHLLVESRTVPKNKLGSLIQETGELIRMLSSIILTTKRGRPVIKTNAPAPQTHNPSLLTHN